MYDLKQTIENVKEKGYTVDHVENYPGKTRRCVAFRFRNGALYLTFNDAPEFGPFRLNTEIVCEEDNDAIELAHNYLQGGDA
jgi:hypothetical protein